MRWSITSIAAGTIPDAITALTVFAASRTLENDASSVRTAVGFGVTRTATRTAMPSVPSPPTNAPRRSRPGGSGSSPPRRAIEPSGRTTSIASTWAFVTPYARQCGPPELLATLPPMVQTCWLEGSGAKWKPSGRRCRVRSRLTTPGSTHTARASRSTSPIDVMRASDTTTGAPSGIAPPASPVPAPRGTTARPWRRAARTTACTSPAVRGKQTGPASPPSNTDASRRSSARCASSVRTFPAPTAPISSRTSSASRSGTPRRGRTRDASLTGPSSPRPARPRSPPPRRCPTCRPRRRPRR